MNPEEAFSNNADEASSDDGEDDVRVQHNNSSKDKAFSFYEFGKLGPENTPFDEILKKLSISYEAQRAASADAWKVNDNLRQQKTFSIKDFQTAQLQKTKTLPVTIARFRPGITQWDGSYYLDEHMKKELYRVPCRDPSGKVIRSLGRDEAKGVTKWRPVEVDRQLPVPSVILYSESYLQRLIKHMDEVVAKLEIEYSNMPSSTLRLSNLKAQAGADLNNMKQNRALILEEMKKQALSSGNNGKATA
jgi:hypothetical protein